MAVPAANRPQPGELLRRTLDRCDSRSDQSRENARRILHAGGCSDVRGVVPSEQVKGVSSAKGAGIMKRTVYLSGNTLEDGKSSDSGDGTKTQGKDVDKDKGAQAKGKPWKAPEIGDLRVRWEMVTPQVVSILGAHGGDGVLEPWLGPGEKKVTAEQSYESVFLLRSGSLGISDLVASVVDRNAGEAWEQRMFGFGTMTMGSFLFCHFMEYTTDYADIVEHVCFPAFVCAVLTHLKIPSSSRLCCCGVRGRIVCVRVVLRSLSLVFTSPVWNQILKASKM